MNTVTASNEMPVYFPLGEDELFGILTEPDEPARDVAVVFLAGGVHVPSANRNRLWVRLTRAVAAGGFHALRMDYRGAGESGGRSEPYDLPRTEELLAAIDWLRGQGFKRFILVGTCFGARTAMAAVSEIEELEGVVLLSPPVVDVNAFAVLARRQSIWRYVLRALRPRVIAGLFKPSRRLTYTRIARAKFEAMTRRERRSQEAGEQPPVAVGAHMLGPLAELARRRVPTLILFGSQDPMYRHWISAGHGRLSKVLSHFDVLDVEVVSGYLHGFPQLANQDAAVSIIRDWFSTRPSEAAAARTG